MKASIIICTHNRAAFLEESIRSVLDQCISDDQFEVIVVDNNSIDHTKQVVDRFITSHCNLRYIFESRQGLSFARNAGIDSSSGSIVVFTDDDIVAGKGWLKGLLTVFDSPDVMGAGGPLRPIWLAPRPDWLPDEMLEPLTISEFPSAHMTGEFKGPYFPWGANMAFRREIFAEVGRFATDLGRIGGCLLSNEELELYSRIELTGKRIRFASDAVIYHKVVPERLRKQWFYHRHYWQGRSDAVLDLRKGESTLPKVNYCLGTIIKQSDSFAERCRSRWAKGYVHQLLFGNIEPSISQIRILDSIIFKGLSALNNIEQNLPEATPYVNSEKRILVWQIAKRLRLFIKHLFFNK